MNYYWNRNDEMETADEPARPAAKHLSPTAIAAMATDVAIKQTEAQLKAIYDKSPEARLALAYNLIKRHVDGKGWTEAQAQLYVLILLREINHCWMRRPYLRDFSEKMIDQLIRNINAYQLKAYPLTVKQFEAAVKTAW